jgi:hypothetical protein
LDLPNGSLADEALDLAALDRKLATLVPALAAGRAGRRSSSGRGGGGALLAAETWVGGACTAADQEASEVWRLEMVGTARKLQQALALHRAQTQAELAATEASGGSGDPAAAAAAVWAAARAGALAAPAGVPEQSEAERRLALAHATRAFVEAL